MCIIITHTNLLMDGWIIPVCGKVTPSDGFHQHKYHQQLVRTVTKKKKEKKETLQSTLVFGNTLIFR